MCGMYSRYAKDLSGSLFDSVYSDLMALAARQQGAIWAGGGKTNSQRRKAYRIGEAQEMLNAFSHGTLSLGEAMDFIAMAK